MNITIETRAAYERYGDEAGWKNYAGLPMPTWGQLPILIQTYWAAAVKPLVERIEALEGGS